MVIFAHVGPPKILFQSRNFDVPLLVIVSGMAFHLSHNCVSYSAYVWKRIKRLIFPTWIFLTFYFLILFVSGSNSSDLTFKTIAGSYLLLQGIGYVWIIRVFFLVALVAPLISSADKMIKSNMLYLIMLLLLFGIYEVCRYYLTPYMQNGFFKFLSQQFFYLFPYSLIFAFGVRISKLAVTTKSFLGVVFFVVFFGSALFFYFQMGHFVSTQYYKYPPSAYYLLYALFVSIFLDLASQKMWAVIRTKTQIKNVILFISQNSIWIYLLHIPFVKLLQMNFVLKYCIVVLTATVLVLVQVNAVNHLLLPQISSKRTKKNIRTILTG